MTAGAGEGSPRTGGCSPCFKKSSDNNPSPEMTEETKKRSSYQYSPEVMKPLPGKQPPSRTGFLVSFLVDARGGAMTGHRHWGMRVIIPPGALNQPTRVNCKYQVVQALASPPPLNEREALASRVIEISPAGEKFSAPVLLEIPHFASHSRAERETIVLRSDDGTTWKEHISEPVEDGEIYQDVVESVVLDNSHLEKIYDVLEVNRGRVVRILTSHFPKYFAVISRVREDSLTIGREGGKVILPQEPRLRATVSKNALNRPIKVGLQVQTLRPELVQATFGRSVEVSKMVSVEPRARKFHQPIFVSIPLPCAANKINANNVRLLCSITGDDSKAQWQDMTGTTPLEVNSDVVHFSTKISAIFWILVIYDKQRDPASALSLASRLYEESILAPYMARISVFYRENFPRAWVTTLRIYCMTDDKAEKVINSLHGFQPLAFSGDIEVTSTSSICVELKGNLLQLRQDPFNGEMLTVTTSRHPDIKENFTFHAFEENALTLLVKAKEMNAPLSGNFIFSRRLTHINETQQIPLCELDFNAKDGPLAGESIPANHCQNLENKNKASEFSNMGDNHRKEGIEFLTNTTVKERKQEHMEVEEYEIMSVSDDNSYSTNVDKNKNTEVSANENVGKNKNTEVSANENVGKNKNTEGSAKEMEEVSSNEECEPTASENITEKSIYPFTEFCSTLIKTSNEITSLDQIHTVEENLKPKQIDNHQLETKTTDSTRSFELMKIESMNKVDQMTFAQNDNIIGYDIGLETTQKSETTTGVNMDNSSSEVSDAKNIVCASSTDTFLTSMVAHQSPTLKSSNQAYETNVSSLNYSSKHKEKKKTFIDEWKNDLKDFFTTKKKGSKLDTSETLKTKNKSHLEDKPCFISTMVGHQVSVPSAIKADCIQDNLTSEKIKNYHQDYMVVDKETDDKSKKGKDKTNLEPSKKKDTQKIKKEGKLKEQKKIDQQNEDEKKGSSIALPKMKKFFTLERPKSKPKHSDDMQSKEVKRSKSLTKEDKEVKRSKSLTKYSSSKHSAQKLPVASALNINPPIDKKEEEDPSLFITSLISHRVSSEPIVYIAQEISQPQKKKPLQFIKSIGKVAIDRFTEDPEESPYFVTSMVTHLVIPVESIEKKRDKRDKSQEKQRRKSRETKRDKSQEKQKDKKLQKQKDQETPNDKPENKRDKGQEKEKDKKLQKQKDQETPKDKPENKRDKSQEKEKDKKLQKQKDQETPKDKPENKRDKSQEKEKDKKLQKQKDQETPKVKPENNSYKSQETQKDQEDDKIQPYELSREEREYAKQDREMDNFPNDRVIICNIDKNQGDVYQTIEESSSEHTDTGRSLLKDKGSQEKKELKVLDAFKKEEHKREKSIEKQRQKSQERRKKDKRLSKWDGVEEVDEDDPIYFLASMVSHRIQGVPYKRPDKKNSFNVLRKEKHPKFNRDSIIDEKENFTPTETPLFITSMVAHTTNSYKDQHKSAQTENHPSKEQSSVPDKKEKIKKSNAIQTPMLQKSNKIEKNEEKMEKKEKKNSFLKDVKNFFTRKKEPKVKGGLDSSSKNKTDYDKNNKENPQTTKKDQNSSGITSDHVFTQYDTSKEEPDQMIYDCMNNRLHDSSLTKAMEESNIDFSSDSSGIKDTHNIKCTEDCKGEGLEYFYLKSGLNNLVLEAGLGDEVPTLRTKRGTENQLWTFCENYLMCKNGLALEIKNGMHDHEAEVVTNPPTNNESQMFYMDKSCIVSMRDETVLDIYYGMTNENNYVWMYSRNGSPAQTWTCVTENEYEDEKCEQDIDLDTKQDYCTQKESQPDPSNSKMKKKRNRNRTHPYADEDTTPCDATFDRNKVKKDISNQRSDDVESLQKGDERDKNKNESDASKVTSNKKKDITLKNQSHGDSNKESSKLSLKKEESTNSSGEKPKIIVADPRGIPRPRRKNMNDIHDSESFSSSVDSYTEKQIEGIKRSSRPESMIETESCMEKQIEGIKKSSRHGSLVESDNNTDKYMQKSSKHGFVIDPDSYTEKMKEVIKKSNRHGSPEAESQSFMAQHIKSVKKSTKHSAVLEYETYSDKDREGKQKSDKHTEGKQKSDKHTEGKQKSDKDTEGKQKSDKHTEGKQKSDKHTEGKQKSDKHTEGNQKSKRHGLVIEPDSYSEKQMEGFKTSVTHCPVAESENFIGQNIEGVNKSSKHDSELQADIYLDKYTEGTQNSTKQKSEKRMESKKKSSKHGLVEESDSYKEKHIEGINKSKKHDYMPESDSYKEKNLESKKKSAEDCSMAESGCYTDKGRDGTKQSNRRALHLKSDSNKNRQAEGMTKSSEGDFVSEPNICTDKNLTDIKKLNRQGSVTESDKCKVKQIEDIKRSSRQGSLTETDNMTKSSPKEIKKSNRHGHVAESDNSSGSSPKQRKSKSRPSSFIIDSEEFNQAVDSFDKLQFEDTASNTNQDYYDKTDVMAPNKSSGSSNDASQRKKKNSEEFNRAVNDSFDRLDFGNLQDSSTDPTTEDTYGARRNDKKEDSEERKEKNGGVKQSKSFVESEEFNKAVDSFDELFLAENMDDKNLKENIQMVHKKELNQRTLKNTINKDIKPDTDSGDARISKKRSDNVTSKNIKRLQREDSTTDSTESEGEINKIVSEGHSYINYQNTDPSRFQHDTSIEPSKKGREKIEGQFTLPERSEIYGKEGNIQMEFDMSAVDGSEKRKNDGHKGIKSSHGLSERTEIKEVSTTSQKKNEGSSQSEKKSRNKDDSLPEDHNSSNRIQPALHSSDALDQPQHSSDRDREVEEMNKKNQEKSFIQNKNIKIQSHSSEFSGDSDIYMEPESGGKQSRSIETNDPINQLSRNDETFQLNEGTIISKDKDGLKGSIQHIASNKEDSSRKDEYSQLYQKSISYDDNEGVNQPKETFIFDKEEIRKSYKENIQNSDKETLNKPIEAVGPDNEFSRINESFQSYQERTLIDEKDRTNKLFEKNANSKEFTGVVQSSKSYEENIFRDDNVKSDRRASNSSIDDEENDNVVLRHSLIIDGNRIKKESEALRFPSAGQSLSNEQDFNIDKDYFKTVDTKEESDKFIKGIVQKHSLTIGADEIFETKCTYLPPEISNEICEPLKLLTGDEKISETKVLYNTDKDGETREVMQSHALQIEDNTLIETKHSYVNVGQSSVDSGNTYANIVKSGLDSGKTNANILKSGFGFAQEHSDAAKSRPGAGETSGNIVKSSFNAGNTNTNVVKSSSYTTDSNANVTKQSSNSEDSNANVVKSSTNTGDSSANITQSSSNTGDLYANVAETSSNSGDSNANISQSSLNTGDLYANVAKTSSNTGDSNGNVAKSSLPTSDSYSNVAKSSLHTGDSYSNVAKSSLTTGDSYSNVAKSSLHTGDSYSNVAKSSLHTGDAYSNVAKSSSNTEDLHASIPKPNAAQSCVYTGDVPTNIDESSSSTGDRYANVAKSHVAKSSVHIGDSYAKSSLYAKSSSNTADSDSSGIKSRVDSGGTYANIVKLGLDSGDTNVVKVDSKDTYKSDTVIVCDENSTIDPEKLKNVDGQAHQRSGFSKFQRRKSNKDKHKSPSRRESEILKDQDYGAMPIEENVNLSTKLEETNVQMRRLEETFTSMCDDIGDIIIRPSNSTTGIDAPIVNYRWTNQLGSGGDMVGSLGDGSAAHIQDERTTVDSRQNFESSVNVRPTIPVYRPVTYGNQSQRQRESETSNSETIPPDSENVSLQLSGF